MTETSIPGTSVEYRQFLYELTVEVPKVTICTKFPCSFYIGASSGKGADIKSCEFVRPLNGQLTFTQPIKLQARLLRERESNAFVEKKITVFLYIRSDNRPAEAIVAGFVKVDLVRELNHPQVGVPRKYILEKCPDRANCLLLRISFKCLGEVKSQFGGTNGKGGIILAGIRAEDCNSNGSQRINQLNLDEYFQNRSGSIKNPVNDPTSKSFFKKKMSLDSDSGFLPPPQQPEYWTPKNAPQRVAQFVNSFKKAIGQISDEVVQSNSKKTLHRADSADCARGCSTVQSGKHNNVPCQRCFYLEQKIIELLRSHKVKEADMKQLIADMEDEFRSYIWTVEEKVHEMQVAMNKKQEEFLKLRIKLQQKGAKHIQELADKDRTIKQLQNCIEQLSQHPSRDHILKQKTLNTSDPQPRPKPKPQAFLPSFLTQAAKSLDHCQLPQKLQSLQASSMLLMDRNQDLLDTVVQLKDDKMRLIGVLRQMAEEADTVGSKRLWEAVEEYGWRNLRDE